MATRWRHRGAWRTGGIALLVLFGTSVAQGQAAKAGRDVRITQRCDSAPCPRLSGKLVATPPDSIVIRTGADPHLAIPRAAISVMEVGHNRHGVRKGAIIGGTFFGVMSGVMGALVCSTMAWDPDSGCGSGVVLGFAIGGGLMGAGLGALLGGLIAPMQWIPVSPTEVRIAVIRLPVGRAGVGVRLVAPW